jgi:PEP-CTERM motif
MFKSVGKGRLLVSLTALAASLAVTSGAHANVDIVPVFDSSITGNSNASEIEGAIDSAISTIGSLYSNNITQTVDFSYTAAAPGNLLSTTQFFFPESYAGYVSALTADSAANPGNTVLATAIANLSKGNDANGAKDLALTTSELSVLGIGSAPPSPPQININSSQPFAFSRPVPGSEFDLTGGLEHELDEVLGGGGAGSTLNSIAGSCTGFFCNKIGDLDPYRYSAPGTPSFTTSGSANSYLSFDGGTTELVAFNQNSSGDYGDFSPPGTGAGQLIQNAFNFTGQDEAYTTSSPEFAMMESIGYNGSATAPMVPEPSTCAMMLLGFAGLGFAGYRKAKSWQTSPLVA